MFNTISIKRVDYILVGGGLAGCCLAIQFWKKGFVVAMIDQPQQNRSSALAAGLFNPITNQVMNKTWRADELFESLHEFYSAAEKILGARFFHPMPLYRPFGSIAEQNSWMARSATPGMEKFIEEISASPRYGHQIHDPYGGILLKQCGYVNVTALMMAVREKFEEEGLHHNEAFSHEALRVEPAIRYKELEASRLIFCEGTGVRANPFFKWLPVNALKGETLEVTLLDTPELIYNRGVYLVPWGNGGYKVGATYHRNAAAGITDEGRAELVQKLDDLIRIPYEIKQQDWGYRPTIIDRRPVLGAHPEFSNLMVFNALGTKGVSLAPHFSGVLASHVMDPAQIEKEVNITRFYPLYSKF